LKQCRYGKNSLGAVSLFEDHGRNYLLSLKLLFMQSKMFVHDLNYNHCVPICWTKGDLVPEPSPESCQ